MNAEQDIQRGEAVKRFLNDPAVKEVFAALDQAYYDQWKAADDLDSREAVWSKQRALADLSKSLVAVVQSGDLAKHQLEKAEQARNER